MRAELKRRFVTLVLFSAVLALVLRPSRASAEPAVIDVPDDFPRFVVPEHQPEMDALRRLFWLHYQNSGPLIPLWDEWMSMSTLWPARADLPAMRQRWEASLAARKIDAEGYVATQQHDGPAHAEGWPFPRWMDAGGIGWHFRGTGIAGYDGPPATTAGWELNGIVDKSINDRGWVMELNTPQASAMSPSFSIDARSSPWLRINWWATGLEGANCYVEWTTIDAPEFSRDRRAYFSPATGEMTGGETRTMIPVYRVSGWKGNITRLRFSFDNPGSGNIVIKSIHTACDTRHPINNPNFIRGVNEYFLWTGDFAFLREQINRVRAAMRFTMREFDTRKRNCIYTTWIGHEGRSGVRIDSAGKKSIVPNEGIGGNYWDLLPFGGEDALATIYYYDALLDLAGLEEAIANHPQWNISRADAFDVTDLRNHAAAVKAYGGKRFWNGKTGRFGTVDLDGNMHDYGWTFLNNEAIYYDFATPEQARWIRDWISGRRIVEGDTSTGDDIYNWRFGPRASTRRNLDYYFWGWSAPETIPWGNQVQDGGAVLGFSYYDLMTRVAVDGPDDASPRLSAIIDWFNEVQNEGGYRAYYTKDPARGTLQGGNVPGGLGVDREFFESILVPQVMLYGCLGFHPTLDGFRIDPHLPKAWPELTITRIHLRDVVLDITASRAGKITIGQNQSVADAIQIELPSENWKSSDPAVKVEGRVATVRFDGKPIIFTLDSAPVQR